MAGMNDCEVPSARSKSVKVRSFIELCFHFMKLFCGCLQDAQGHKAFSSTLFLQ